MPTLDQFTNPNKPGEAEAYVQWKGTDVCMDIRCKCGFSGHLDTFFAYHVRCPKCETVYACNPYIQLVELAEGEVPIPDIVKELDDDDEY